MIALLIIEHNDIDLYDMDDDDEDCVFDDGDDVDDVWIERASAVRSWL